MTCWLQQSRRDGKESFKSPEKLKKPIIDYRIEPVIFTPFLQISRLQTEKGREREIKQQNYPYLKRIYTHILKDRQPPLNKPCKDQSFPPQKTCVLHSGKEGLRVLTFTQALLLNLVQYVIHRTSGQLNQTCSLLGNIASTFSDHRI